VTSFIIVYVYDCKSMRQLVYGVLAICSFLLFFSWPQNSFISLSFNILF
jgi:hypothetical protein